MLAVGLDRAQPLAAQPRPFEQPSQARERVLYDPVACALERLVALEQPQPPRRDEQRSRLGQYLCERLTARCRVVEQQCIEMRAAARPMAAGPALKTSSEGTA